MFHQLCRKLDPFPKGKRWLLMLTGVFGCSSMAINYFGLHHLPLAYSTMVISSSSLFICFHARIILKEPIQKLNILNVLLVLGGLILIIKPPLIFGFTRHEFLEDPLAFTALMAMAFSSMVIFPLVNINLRLLKGNKCFPNLASCTKQYHCRCGLLCRSLELWTIFLPFDWNQCPGL